MKKQSYQSITDKTITDIKVYTLAIAPSRYEQEVADIVNTSIDAYSLKKKLNQRKDIALAIFINIKKCLDQADSLLELEEHLVYMNILLDAYFKPVVSYKYNLFQYLVKEQYFNIDIYCILRHLIKFNNAILPEFIRYMTKLSNQSSYSYHYLATTIYCIEHDYKKAYQHIQYISFDNELEVYRRRLYNYSPYKYHRCIQKHTVKEIVFS